MDLNKKCVSIENLNVFYGDKQALKDVNLSVPQGKMIAIIGPNGSGKSTLLKSIMGLVKPKSGRISICGEPIQRAKAKIAYVPQKESVDWDFPITVKEVVRMGRYSNKLFARITKEDKAKSQEIMEMLEIESLQNRHISQLSGGQQQRVFLARALAQEADIMFLDEPFAGIDASSELKIIEIARSLRDQGKTLIFVHHALNTVMEYFDHVIMLNNCLIADGATQNTFTQENINACFAGIKI